MTELLTAKDVEIKAFKKVSFGGYSVAEVEDFLNQVADDLEAYALRVDERDNRIRELEDYIKKQDSMTDMIKDALIQARKAASDMEDQARAQTERILADARADAEKCVAEATTKAREIDGQVHARLDDAERSAAEIVAKAKFSAEDILKDSQDKRDEVERRWGNLEQDLAARRQEAEEQAEQTLASARAEARRIVDEASREAEEYANRVRTLNLQKQQFLKDTVALLLDFGKTIDKAQQDTEAEMGLRFGEYGQEDADAASPRLIERFRKNLLEGKDSPEGQPIGHPNDWDGKA
ncbi:MAG: DivIVA domain-containing protein [Synergistaceae bacterium]|nr:DivIVA domain-containing protein [Synergistaceae bacterium]